MCGINGFARYKFKISLSPKFSNQTLIDKLNLKILYDYTFFTFPVIPAILCASVSFKNTKMLVLSLNIQTSNVIAWNSSLIPVNCNNSVCDDFQTVVLTCDVGKLLYPASLPPIFPVKTVKYNFQ